MSSKNSLLLGRGIFIIFTIVALGLIVMNEKGGSLFLNKIDKQLENHFEKNYQDIKNNVIVKEAKYKEGLFQKKIVSKENNNLFFYIEYKDKKITDTYTKDYKEGKTLFNYLNKELEKEIKNKTKIECTIQPVTTLDKYSEKVRERIIKEDNLLQLKYYYLDSEIMIEDWNEKNITEKINNVIKKMDENNITPKYYKLTITNKKEITTSIEISNITEDFITQENQQEIIKDILDNKNSSIVKESKIEYRYEN